ncbi:calcium-binding protein [Derxia lacustris]|uniref:calcium-binding protein n=1 Tax=Derxia lacustris TaxID=764842 RepID=UPI0015933777|nr:calcium-binding protein [Derxia lacustris]
MGLKRGGHDDVNHEINHIRGGRGADDIAGTVGDDSVTGGAGHDLIHTGAGDDSIDGGSGNDRISAGAGNDDIAGGSGNDRLDAGAGDDRLAGGSGRDVLTGGAGDDTFVFSDASGADRITDFTSGGDKISLAATVLGIGNGDAVIDNAVAVAGPGGFTVDAELVIVEGDVAAGRIEKATVAAGAIGSADSAYAVGDTRVFVIDDGVHSAVWLFEAGNADAVVDASELTLLADVHGSASTALGDYVFA